MTIPTVSLSQREKPEINYELEEPIANTSLTGGSSREFEKISIKEYNDLANSAHSRHKELQSMGLVRLLLIGLVVFAAFEICASNLWGFQTTEVYKTAFETLRLCVMTLLGYAFGSKKSSD